MQKVKIAGLGVVGALCLGAAAFAAAPPALYTAAQATAGATEFNTNCSSCHGQDLAGGAGPALIGQAFAAPSNNYTVGAIFTELSQQMPAGQPGSLSHTQYEEIFAYILQKNGYPAGTTAVNYDKAMADTTPLVSQVK